MTNSKTSDIKDSMAKKVELLAPAGSLEKLIMAVLYGADAVYVGGEAYGLRAGADNFSPIQMSEGIEFAHAHNCKVYITLNIIPHNSDLEGLEEYLTELEKMGADAVIVSDPGIFSIVRNTIPSMPVHISTQANNTNYQSAMFWHRLGAERIILARELSLAEVRDIRDRLPETAELELFVHGAMCISYSGRCLLSSYMTGRDSNRGECAHPCRWKYHLVEEKRPGEYMPVYENERGTFIFNSKDLCMIDHIPELIASGAGSFKIEGRMKSAYYVATVVKAYRQAIDAYYADPAGYTFQPEWLDEVSKASHREFTTGFYFNKADSETQVYSSSSYIRDYDFVGLVTGGCSMTDDNGNPVFVADVEQRNRMFVGDEIEVVPPTGSFYTQKIQWMEDAEGQRIESAPHPQMKLTMPLIHEIPPNTILRRKG